MSTPTQPRIALVTGGTTGIGLATARLLHAQGARVIITGQNRDNLDRARRELPDDVVVLRADARSVADARTIADEIRRRFGRLDVAFLNAGVARFAPLDAFDEGFYDDQMDTNVKGVLFTLQAVLPLLSKGASVIVNSSVLAHKGFAGASTYAATKGALAAIVRSLAVELAPRGIRINAINPGPIETPIYGKLGLPADAMAGFKDGMVARVPLGRFGVDDEVARAVGFLASTESAFITGAEVPVDGGLAAA